MGAARGGKGVSLEERSVRLCHFLCYPYVNPIQSKGMTTAAVRDTPSHRAIPPHPFPAHQRANKRTMNANCAHCPYHHLIMVSSNCSIWSFVPITTITSFSVTTSVAVGAIIIPEGLLMATMLHPNRARKFIS
jgi:hypothetical protein